MSHAVRSRVRFVKQCCARACALVRFATTNMSQHIATEWPNAPNMLRTMLQSFGRGLQILGQECCDMLR